MKYETIPYVDKPVSRILFGTAQPSFLRGEENNAIQMRASCRCGRFFRIRISRSQIIKARKCPYTIPATRGNVIPARCRTPQGSCAAK